MRLIRKGKPTFRPAPVAEMSAAEQAGQSILADIVAGGAFADPRTSPLYQGFRAESEAEEASGASELRRRSQLAGMFQSSPGIRAEGDYRKGMAASRLGMLGQMYESERARDNPYTRLAAASQYGALPRQIEQAQQQSVWDARMQRKMFPYTTLAPIATTLLGAQPSTYFTPPQPSTFANVMGGMGAGLNMAGTAAMMGGPLGLGLWGGGGAGTAAPTIPPAASPAPDYTAMLPNMRFELPTLGSGRW
ncbi:MAG TPA: hypothetical protein VM223_08730 [Planctomycetota bacterium]|nr:hypothetical protein [Planctomycetota bacterium]